LSEIVWGFTWKRGAYVCRSLNNIQNSAGRCFQLIDTKICAAECKLAVSVTLKHKEITLKKKDTKRIRKQFTANTLKKERNTRKQGRKFNI